MLTQDSTIEDINFLTQSPVRIHILELLDEAGEMHKRELTERFDVSRVTIQRNVDALEERDWITSSHPTYEITPLGELVVAEVTPLRESVSITDKLRPFLKWIPREALDFDYRLLSDATIIEADRTNPTDWVHHHTDRLRSASVARALLPGTGTEAWDAAIDSSADGELVGTVVVTPAVAETLRTEPAYTDKIDVLFERDALELYVYDGHIPYHLGRLDRYVHFVVMDDEGIPRALVETDSAAVREWADHTFESYLNQSRRFER